eukprot:TRINITY_DN6006_c0_g1_i1.p1 TRINITY_DN6006_c0_g1~~TRINITY_DN6006_c0_g1_i1.p1  ORF type:complete len:180 (+),score=9.12 TRINITY_DN6006_c0_g1_i1:62-601(+)
MRKRGVDDGEVLDDAEQMQVIFSLTTQHKKRSTFFRRFFFFFAISFGITKLYSAFPIVPLPFTAHLTIPWLAELLLELCSAANFFVMGYWIISPDKKGEEINRNIVRIAFGLVLLSSVFLSVLIMLNDNSFLSLILGFLWFEGINLFFNVACLIIDNSFESIMKEIQKLNKLRYNHKKV